jgi:uncharacterized protein YndB with AHSA1/START domain
MTIQNNGVFLEVIMNEKLVFTVTCTAGWKPDPKTFIAAIVTFEIAGPSRTSYTAIARHRSKDAADTHKQMGFHDGWAAVATQLEAYAQGLQT